MATTKIWPVKRQLGYVLRYAANEEKTELSRHPDLLGSALRYVTQDGKTDLGRLVSGINCTPDTAQEVMTATKQQFGKTGGTMAFHGYQSFATGEVTPEQAHNIGVQLAYELWGERFQVLVATHLDKESHIHNHFVINSVSFLDGKRFHSDAAFLHRMREVSDRLCLENGLSVVWGPGQGRTKHYAEYKAEKEGKPTWRSIIKADMDQVIAHSMTDSQFFYDLRQMGYDYKTGQDISVRPPGKERYFRLARNLGNEYSMEGIRRRMFRNRPKWQSPAEPRHVTARRHYRMRGTLPKKQQPHLRRLYFYYCYKLGVFKKHPQSPEKMHFLLREELRYLENYNRELRFLHDNHILTDVQLQALQNQREQELAPLVSQRRKLKYQLKKETEPEEATRIQEEIDALSRRMTALRADIRMCKNIMERSRGMAEKMERIRTEETNQQMDERQQGYQMSR